MCGGVLGILPPVSEGECGLGVEGEGGVFGGVDGEGGGGVFVVEGDAEGEVEVGISVDLAANGVIGLGGFEFGEEVGHGAEDGEHFGAVLLAEGGVGDGGKGGHDGVELQAGVVEVGDDGFFIAWLGGGGGGGDGSGRCQHKGSGEEYCGSHQDPVVHSGHRNPFEERRFIVADGNGRASVILEMPVEGCR